VGALQKFTLPHALSYPPPPCTGHQLDHAPGRRGFVRSTPPTRFCRSRRVRDSRDASRKAPGLRSRTTDVIARIYNLRGKFWVDLASYYQDGSSITYSTADVGEKLPRPSTQTVIRFPDFSLAQLHHRLVHDRPRGPLRPATTANFVDTFLDAHAA